jgi:hypothetical protein
MSQSPDASSREYPEQTILGNVPRIGFDIHLCPFPGSLFAAMKHIGDRLDYDYLMGVSGRAFRRFWNRDDGGNVDLMYLAPEPYERAFRSIGRAYEVAANNDKAGMLRVVGVYSCVTTTDTSHISDYKRLRVW